MWYQSTDENGNVRKREGMSLDDQKKYYGWDGISPTYNKELKPWIHKARLNIKMPDGECSQNKSSCVVTCKGIIRDILYKYPRPRDCMVGAWKSWNECSKPCGGGEQSRSRDILYPDRYGGTPCPELTSKRVCNMNKGDLIDAVASAANMSKADAGRAVDAVVGSVTSALSNGGSVSLVGFGTFSVSARAARMGRNPQTGEAISIKACNVPKFKAGKGLKDAVN